MRVCIDIKVEGGPGPETGIGAINKILKIAEPILLGISAEASQVIVKLIHSEGEVALMRKAGQGFSERPRKKGIRSSPHVALNSLSQPTLTEPLRVQ